MNWILTILGANSAVPTRDRYPSAQVLDVGKTHILIDCGEGTQLRMLEQNVKSSRISVILISHLHGDHIYGLPGLLTSYNLFSRKLPLRIIGPVGIRKFVECTIGITGHELSYPLECIEINSDEKCLVHKADGFEVFSFPLEHRIPTYGYSIREKVDRVYMDKAKIQEHRVSDSDVQRLLDGETVKIGSRNRDLSYFERERLPVSYSYVSDTKWFSKCSDFVRGTTLLYHESTFLEKDSALAGDRFHSTAMEAARCAWEASAKNLLLGHFSSRYKDLDPFKSEAESIFKPVFLAKYGRSFWIFNDGRIQEE